MNQIDNNKLRLVGRLVSDPEFYYEAYDEKFYTFNLEVLRLSKNSDYINVLISEKILDSLKAGDCVEINGQIRSYNKYEDSKKRLAVFAFCKEIRTITEEELFSIKNPNEVTIVGYLCKRPVYRNTPLGREIADLLVAVNRAYKKSDYIPAIAWGRNAKYCENKVDIGDCVQVTGRFQSRNYTKKIEGSEDVIKKTAYEISICRIKVNKTEDITPEA